MARYDVAAMYCGGVYVVVFFIMNTAQVIIWNKRQPAINDLFNINLFKRPPVKRDQRPAISSPNTAIIQ